MKQKSKISQRMAMGLLPIIGKTKTKRQVENLLHTIGKTITLLTIGMSAYFNFLICGIVTAMVFTVIGYYITDAFLEAMYGDGKYANENGDTEPMMQLFKTLKDLNDNNLTKKKENV